MKATTREWVDKAEADYAVEVRYPGRTVGPKEANELLRDASHIRLLARRSLGLP